MGLEAEVGRYGFKRATGEPSVDGGRVWAKGVKESGHIAHCLDLTKTEGSSLPSQYPFPRHSEAGMVASTALSGFS